MAYEINDYPQELPIQAAKDLIAGITGGTIGANLSRDVLAAMNLLLYAEGQMLGNPHLIGDAAGVGAVAIDDAKAASLLTEAVAEAEQPDGVVGAAAIPWGPLAAYLIQLLLDRLLKKS